MKRSRELVGAKVLDEKDNMLGIIRGIDYEHEQKNIRGFYIEKKGALSRKAYLPYNEITDWGEKTVSIKSPDVLTKTSFPFLSYDISYALNRADAEIGYISDFLFDEKVGDILGVEVSVGPYDDMNYGRTIYANYEPNKGTGDIIIDEVNERSE